MKKAFYIILSLIFWAVSFLFFVTVTVPWTDEMDGGIKRGVLTVVVIMIQTGLPGFFLGRAVTHEEPEKFTNQLNRSL